MRSAPTFSPTALRLARLRAGLTQLEVAERCAAQGHTAVTQPLMSHWENGRQAPAVGNLPVLAAVLGCPVDEFFPPQAPADAEAVVA